jgi:AraC-like DNA-binding protein
MGDPERSSGGGRPAAYVRRVKAFLDTAPAGRVRVRDLAELAGVGAEQLRHAFKSYADAAPIVYLNQARAARAAELLRAGRTPSQAAAAVGFYDEPHLHRHFKRLTGQTPARYARLHARPHADAGRPDPPGVHGQPSEESARAKPMPK